MGHIDAAEVRKIALLGRLQLSDDEVTQLGSQLEAILAHVDQLREVDVEGVEPFLNAAAEGNIFRDDASRPGLPTADALANAPEKVGSFFRVPQVT